jgi:3',5'-cyclic AMP phosphodiesterase CpdA
MTEMEHTMENNHPSRRHCPGIVLSGAVLVLSFFALSGCRGGAAGLTDCPKPRTIRFGICADVHKDIMHDADTRLDTFIRRMNREKVDFIIQLGDFCRPYEANQGFLDIWNGFDGPRYHVLGNHDTDGGFTREQTLEFWGTKDKYYSFDLGGRHFVVLDGNDKKKQGAAPGYPRYIGLEQVEWLRHDLAATEFPTLIFCHQSLENTGGVENGQAIRGLLEEANREAGFEKVVACFSGHHHTDYDTVIEGIHYIQINSMSYEWLGADYRHARFSPAIEKAHPWVSYTAPYRDALYAIVTVRTNGTIQIDGVQSDWIQPGPAELGVPEREGLDRSTPTLSNRILKPR